jgi:NRPS condensation-like uncharacterized protein
MQAGLLYETLSGRTGNYVQQVTVTCREQLDSDALRRAWLALVRRHRALRTSFVIGESAMPRQRIHEEVDLGLVVADLRGLSDDEREIRWQELLVAERTAGFEPAYPPLMRVAIYRFADAETRVLWTYHAILDGRWASRSCASCSSSTTTSHPSKPLSGTPHCPSSTSRNGPRAAAAIRPRKRSGARS